MVYVYLLLFAVALIGIYFLPYKKLRGAIFHKIIANPADIYNIRFKGRDVELELTRVKNGFSMIFPDKWQASFRVKKLLNKLAELDIVKTIPKDVENQYYGIGKNGELSLTYPKKIVRLVFGSRCEDPELMYINNAANTDVFVTSSVILGLLPQSVMDFKEMRLFEVEKANITSVEVRFENKGYLLVKTDIGWSMRGENVFDQIVEEFLDKLLETEADKFLQKGLKLPPKALGAVTVKADSRHSATRYFFLQNPEDTFYVTPLAGEVVSVSKKKMEEIFTI